MTPLLFAVCLAALAALAAPAAAQTWYDDAVKDWNASIQPAENIEWTRFEDEAGRMTSLYFKDRRAPWTTPMQLPLYVLQAAPEPERKVISLDAPSGYKTPTMDVDLVTFGGAQVSPYYLDLSDVPGRGLTRSIRRRDRPETRLEEHFNMGSYYPRVHPWPPAEYNRNPEIGKNFRAADGTIPWARVMIPKPSGIASASKSPLVALVPWCQNIEAWWAPAPDAQTQVDLGFIPQEVELWVGNQDPLVAKTLVRGAPLYKEAVAGAGKADYAKAVKYHEWFREQAKLAVGNIAKPSVSGNAPKDRFTPEETRFLNCRMTYLRKYPQFMKLIQDLNEDAPKTESFVSFWRQYMLRELNDYLNLAPNVPKLPATVPHQTYADALAKRGEDALNGKLSGVNVPTTPTVPPPPVVAVPPPPPPKRVASQPPPINLPDPGDAFK